MAAAQEPAPLIAAAPPTPAPARPAIVRLLAPSCTGVPFDRTRLVELLRVELRPLGVTDVTAGSDPPGSPPAPALDDGADAVVLVAPYACDEVAEVALTIADRATKKTVTRRLNVADVDAAGRPRVLAIAIAELLGASWVEFALAASPATPTAVPENAQRALAARLVPAVSAQGLGPGPSAAPAVPAVDGEAPGRPPSSESPWSVDAGVITRLFASRSTALLGGALGVSYGFTPALRFHLAGELSFGEADVSVGSITTNAATASLGVAIATQGATQLELEPHVVVGAGWAKGHSTDANVSSRSYTDWLGIAAVTGTVRGRTGRLTPFVALELGYTFATLSFLVDATRAAGFAGAVLGARVGCGWDL